jgi:hypothetical protein
VNVRGIIGGYHGRRRRTQPVGERVGRTRGLSALAAVLVVAVVLVAALPRTSRRPGDQGGPPASWTADPTLTVDPSPPVPVAENSTAPQDGPSPEVPVPSPPESTRRATQPAGGTPTTSARPVAPAVPAPAPLSYEAEAPGNRLGRGVAPRSVTGASGGWVVGWIGYGGSLRFMGVTAAAAGRYTLTIYYTSAEVRSATVLVNGGPQTSVWFPPTRDWTTIGSVSLPVTLARGRNTVELGRRDAWAPDIDRLGLTS